MGLPGYSPYYHAHSRRMIAVMVSLFSGLRIQRRDKTNKLLELVTVPVDYAAYDKYVMRSLIQDQDDKGLKSKGHGVFPRIEVLLTDMDFDPSRNSGKNERVVIPIDDQTARVIQAPVPYDYKFEVWIASKNFNDGMQVVEQILPYFRPTMTVVIKGDPYADPDKIPITLDSFSWTDNFDNNMEESTRRVIFTLAFTVKYGLAGPAGTAEEQEVKDIIDDENEVPPDDRDPVKPIRRLINEVIIDGYMLEDTFADSALSDLRITVASTDREVLPTTVIERPPTEGREP